MSDGAVWTSAGGLRSTSTTSLSYDAKRYRVEYVVTSWPDPDFDFKAARPEAAKPFPNQVIRKAGNVTYTTTIAQPTLT